MKPDRHSPAHGDESGPDSAAPGLTWREAGTGAALGLLPVVTALVYACVLPGFALQVDDAVSSLQPNTSECFRQLDAGRLPLWSDHTLCGQPLYARGQLIHPGSLLGHLACRLTGVPDRELFVAYLFYLWVGCTCAWLFLRWHGCVPVAAAIGTISFGYAGPFWGFWTNWNTYAWAMAMIPPALLAVEEAIDRGRHPTGSAFADRILPAAFVAVVSSVLTLVADPQLLVKHVALVALYTACRLPPRWSGRAAANVAYGLGLAGCCGLAPCFAVATYVSMTDRVSAGGLTAQEFFSMPIAPWHYLGLVDPFLEIWWQGFRHEPLTGAALGVGPLVALVIGGLLTANWWRAGATRSLTIVCGAAVLLSLGAYFPPNAVLRAIPVVNNFRWPMRWSVEVCGCLPLLVGLATDAFLRERAADARGIIWRRATAALGLLWMLRLAAPSVLGAAGLPPVDSLIGGLAPLGSAVWCATTFGLVAGAPLVSSRRWRWLAVLAVLAGGLVTIPVAQLQRFARPDLTNLLDAPVRPAIDTLERTLVGLEIDAQRQLQSGGNLTYGLPHQFASRSVTGYAYRLAWQSWQRLFGMQGEVAAIELFRSAFLDPAHMGLLHMLRVGALAVHHDDGASRALVERHGDFVLEMETQDLAIYRHTGFRAPAWFVRHAIMTDEVQVLVRDVDVRETAVVTSGAAVGAGRRTFPGGSRVVSYHEDHGRIDIRVAGEAEGLLVISHTYHPFWEATIDGQRVPVDLVNGGFMAIHMPPRAATVQLRYAPDWLHRLLVVSGVAWITTLLVVGGGLLSASGHGRRSAGAFRTKASGGIRGSGGRDRPDRSRRAGRG